MKIIIYSETNAATIHANIGKPEYSYYYVLKSFMPMLQRFADVITVTQPEREVDEIYHRCIANNEVCYFLSFSPPHRTLTTLRCPTIAVFAWEFDSIPDQKWGVEPRSDWRYVLNRITGAIVHSSYTESVVKASMGDGYPVITVPSPLWNRKNVASRSAVPKTQAELRFPGWLLDTRKPGWDQFQNELDWDRESDGLMLVPHRPPSKERQVQVDACDSDITSSSDIIRKHMGDWLKELKFHFFPSQVGATSETAVPDEDRAEYFPEDVSGLLRSQEHKIVLGGVVYTTVLNPTDGRKNLVLLVREFCNAFRDEPQATLVIKSNHFRSDFAIAKVIAELLRQPHFQCRIVVISGYLDDRSYGNLLQATTYTLNASYGEGQCLPLMEYMTKGIPAISPDHTALADYISPLNAFVVSHYREPACWPHDPRQVLTTFKHQIRASSLRTCYHTSFNAARDDARYRSMSEAATQAIEAYCSIDLMEQRLKEFLESEWFKGISERDRERKSILGTFHFDALDSKQVGLTDAGLAGWLSNDSSEIVRGVQITARDIVLDVGCGATTFCADAGAHVVFSAVEEQTIIRIRNELEANGCEKFEGIVADSTQLPVETGTVTKILALETLEHAEDPDQVMKELARVGAPGAQYVLTLPGTAAEQVALQIAPEGHFKSPHHVRIFSRDDFIKVVESAGLVIEDYRQDGFYWSIWMSLYWASQRAEGHDLKAPAVDMVSPPYNELLECWAKTWGTLLAMPGGDKLKSALDEVLPKRQTIIARKP